jgi:uncharacterized protein YycO
LSAKPQSNSPAFDAGDILLFYRPVGKDRVISLVTKSPYFHVALGCEPHVIVEAVPRGVRRRDLRSAREQHPYLVIPAFTDSSAAAVAWALAQVGDGYDSADLAVIILHRIFKMFQINHTVGDRFTCGEFVASAYEHAGRRLFPDIDTEDVVPADFARFLPEKLRRARSSKEIEAALGGVS